MTRLEERLYLSAMLSAIDRALDHARVGREAFMRDAETQHAVVRSLDAIGEAVRGVSEATRQAHPEIPWGRISGTPNRVERDRRVDLDHVWEIVQDELPPLRHQIAELLPVVKRPGGQVR